MIPSLILVTVARNNMRMMLKGDFAFFYHSNCKTPGIAGVMEIVQEHSPDGKETLINYSTTLRSTRSTVQILLDRFSFTIIIAQVLIQSQNPHSTRLILTTTQSLRQRI